MSTLIQTHPPQMTLYINKHHVPPSGGILLNGAAGPSTRYSTHLTRDKFATSKSLPPSDNDRKIRFAPLPDPRKPTSSDEDKSPIQGSLPKLLYSNGDVPSSRSLPEKLASTATPEETDRDEGGSATNGGRRGKKRTFLKLLGVNTSPIQDATLGLNLFRSGSRDSNGSSSDAASSAGGDSSGSNSPRKHPASGAPGANNSFSLTGKTRRPPASDTRPNPPNPPTVAPVVVASPPSPRSKSQPLRPTISAPSASVLTESPIKMLNGRVYGARTQQQQQLGDWAEPEFVEWGYGGMGSNKSGEAFYGGVQGKSAVMEGDDDYEASGMGWVRRRREKREREAREREERERREAGVQREVERTHERGGKPGATTPPKIVVHTSEPEHDYTTITIPHRHHSRQSSRSNSLVGVSTLSSSSSSSSVPTVSSMTKRPSPLSTSHIYGEGTDLERSDSPSRSSEEYEYEASSPRRDNDEEDEDDEEEELRDEKRVTSLCAGKEKISRHRE